MVSGAATSGFEGFCIVGSHDRVRAVESKPFTTLKPEVIEDRDLSIRDVRQTVESDVKSFYNADGFLRGLIRHRLLRFAPRRLGHVVLVCDTSFQSNEKFFTDLIRDLQGVPTMFVLLVPAQARKDVESAYDAGFDLVMDYADLNRVPVEVTRHFDIIKRNRGRLEAVRGRVIAVVAGALVTLAVGFLSQAGRDFYLRLFGTPAVSAQRLPNIVEPEWVLNELTPQRCVGSLLLHSTHVRGLVTLRTETEGISVGRIPSTMVIAAGTTQCDFALNATSTFDKNSKFTVLVTTTDGHCYDATLHGEMILKRLEGGPRVRVRTNLEPASTD